MGRASRRKRDRRIAAQAAPARSATPELPFERKSMLALASAALHSPSAVHCFVSSMVVFDLAVRSPPNAGRTATGADLPEVVRWVHRANPWISQLEDYIPSDPVVDVRVRFGRRCFRLHPATQSAPAADVHRAELLADALDPVLIADLGFGIFDYVELLLLAIDASVRQLAPLWTLPIAKSLAQDPAVTEPEVAEASRLPPLESLLPRCSDPDRAAKALEYATANVSSLLMGLPETQEFYGPIVRVQDSSDSLHSLPAPLLAGAIHDGTLHLAQRASKLPGALEAWRKTALVRLDLLLWRLRTATYGPVQLPDGRSLDAILMLGARHAVAVSLAVGLDEGSMRAALGAEEATLRAVQPGMTLRFGSKFISIPSDAEVERMLVAVGASHLTLLSGPPDMALASLDDLDRITRTGTQGGTDLYLFLQDYRLLRARAQVHAWVLGDAWEMWIGQGKTFRTLPGYNFIGIEAGEAQAEWAHAAKESRLEEALARLGLPSVQAFWPRHARSETTTGLQSPDSGSVLLVLHSEATCVVEVAHDEVPDDLWRDTVSFAEGLLWALSKNSHAIAAVQSELGGHPWRIRIRTARPEEAPNGAALLAVAADTLDLGVAASIREIAEGEPKEVSRVVGEALLKGIRGLVPRPGSPRSTRPI